MTVIYSNELFRIDVDGTSVKFVLDVQPENMHRWHQVQTISYKEKDKLKALSMILYGKHHPIIIDSLIITYDQGYLSFRIGNEIQTALNFPIKLDDKDKIELLHRIDELIEYS